MSVFMNHSVACPACGEPVEFDVNFSVNADRRPDLRRAIVDGSFQSECCSHCQKYFRLEPEVTYVDVARGQWLLVRSPRLRPEWPQLELAARECFERAFGSAASRDAREMGAGLVPRVTFGWTALREKIVCAQAGLDEFALEMSKLQLLRGLPDNPYGANVDLRLHSLDGSELVMAWISLPDESSLETLRVPRAMHDAIVGAPARWRALRAQLADALYLDINRLLVEAVPA